jgi:hypothetical protein
VSEPPDNIIDLSAPYGRKKDGTPKKPRGFQRGGAAFTSGPSSIPAGGFIASPPRGAGAGPEVLIPGQPPEKRAMGEASRMTREEAAERAFQVNVEIMLDQNEPGATRSMAAERVANRVEGTPVQRVINATLDDIQRMKDDELAAELEAVRRKGASPSA